MPRRVGPESRARTWPRESTRRSTPSPIRITAGGRGSFPAQRSERECCAARSSRASPPRPSWRPSRSEGCSTGFGMSAAHLLRWSPQATRAHRHRPHLCLRHRHRLRRHRAPVRCHPARPLRRLPMMMTTTMIMTTRPSHPNPMIRSRPNPTNLITTEPTTDRQRPRRRAARRGSASDAGRWFGPRTQTVVASAASSPSDARWISVRRIPRTPVSFCGSVVTIEVRTRGAARAR